MKYLFSLTSMALAASVCAQTTTSPPATATDVSPQPDTTEQVLVSSKRARRVSKGATGLPLEIKDTPQSISTIDQQDMADFGTSGSLDALRLGTGVQVEQYETNRAEINARGFGVQLTQIDGLGMTNDWGVVVGQLDTFLFDRIELIRGANGLLTGVGNASGTVNYVRKRPRNQDGGELLLSGGSWGLKRAAGDYNKVLSDDGRWAARLVVAHEDKDSYLRSLHDQRTSIYAVVDGQIGDSGVLTIGLTDLRANQDSPMWGSLTLNRADGSLADFPASSSTSQDWTFWNTRSQSAFVEYSHTLSPDWEARLTFSQRKGQEDVQLLYAFSNSGSLNADNTGLYGWPYASYSTTSNRVLDAQLNGRFSALGRQHELIAGVSHARQSATTWLHPYDTATYQFLPLPAFPYGGDVYPEPDWQALSFDRRGEQQLTRLYAASRLRLTEQVRLIAGVNAIELKRTGSSQYGGATDGNDTMRQASPYLGLTWELTPDLLTYASYSDIFQNQDQTDINGHYLAPMKGVNWELGAKADWLDRRLLTTLALFTAQQKGLATYAGVNSQGNYYYEPKDVKSSGIELEATGRVGADTRITAGLTRLRLTGPDGKDIYEWVPRTMVHLRADTRMPGLPAMRFGLAGRWQSSVSKLGGAYQSAYLVAQAFASYDIDPRTTVRLNIDNLFDKKYIGTVAYGAIYGAPRHGSLALEFKL